MSRIFFTADLHFGHENVIRYAERPFASVDEMDATLVGNWNSLVRPGDRVYVLGDLALCKEGRADELVGALAGQKFLIRGNHDRLKPSFYERHFVWSQDLATLKVKDPLAHGGTQRIEMCHYAMRVWNQSHRGAWHLYGHSHGTLSEPAGPSTDVGVDSWGYSPVAYEQLRSLLSGRSADVVDHHGARR